MPRPRSPARVNGPYYDTRNRTWKLRIFDGSRIDRAFSTEAEAEAAKRAIHAQLMQARGCVLDDALTEYLHDKELRGRAKRDTCIEQGRCLRIFLASHLHDDLSRVTPRSAELLYQTASTKPVARTGQQRAAATHRYYLTLAKAFFAWAVRKGRLDQNPFAGIEPEGRVSAGKIQLRLDEARRYRDAALRLFDEGHDVLALAAVVPLYLGLRSGELLRRRVRDVDAAGSLLWIDTGKTRNARRHLKVEAPALQQRLSQLAAGRPADALLFGSGSDDRPRARQALHAAVRRVCRQANVPRVCPHSLRGLFATLGLEAGAASSAVAAALGHASFEVTARHYAQPEALTQVRSARVIGLLDEIDDLTAEQIVEKLSPATLAKIVELSAARLRTNRF